MEVAGACSEVADQAAEKLPSLKGGADSTTGMK
jgi:hypothetical protein